MSKEQDQQQQPEQEQEQDPLKVTVEVNSTPNNKALVESLLGPPGLILGRRD